MEEIKALEDVSVSNKETLETFKEIASKMDEEEETEYRIVNIIGSMSFGTRVDLNKVATSVRNAEYNPKKFPAVILRIFEPKATALVFENGKCNVIGCPSEELTFLASKKFARIIKLLGYTVTIKDFKMSNLVTTVDFHIPIHLESLATAKGHRVFVQYEPEIFCGLVYRMAQPSLTFIIFVSGKVIITGAKSREEIEEGIKYIKPIVKQYSTTKPDEVVVES